MSIIKEISDIIASGDALLIGASNGLSIAEGYNIFADNEMFRKQFGEFWTRYGIRNVLDGCFHDYPDPSARKAFLEALVFHWVCEYTPSKVLRSLMSLVRQKDYFIVTSNADTHLELSGFSPERVFEIEGTFELWLDDLPVVDKSTALAAFVERYRNARLVMLELGIGSRNQLIKEPMMRLCSQLENAKYVILNLEHEIFVPQYLSSKALALPGDLSVTLKELEHACAR